LYDNHIVIKCPEAPLSNPVIMKQTLFIFALLTLFTACEKNNEVADLNADFTLMNTLIRIGENVPIENVSDSISVNYHWDFGDGFTSTEKAPLHSYNNSGTYDIKLITTASHGRIDSVIQRIRVGEAYIYQMNVTHLSENKREGGAWDSDSTGTKALPDVFIQFYDKNDKLIYQSNTIYNVSQENLPLSFAIPHIKTGASALLSPINDESLSIIEDDGVNQEEIISTKFIGIQFGNGFYDKKNHKGELSASMPGASITMWYTIE